MKAQLIIAFALSLPHSAMAAAPSDLYRCELTQSIPGFAPETLVGYLAPSDTRHPGPGQLLNYPNIHLGRGHTGIDAVVYGFHGGNSAPGSRLLVQLIEEKTQLALVSNYKDNTPARVAVEHVRENDKASFSLACEIVK